MNNDAEERLDSLFAKARAISPDTSAAEEFFETRLLARLRERRAPWQAWFSWTWRLMPVFAIVVLLLAITSAFNDRSLSQDVFASLANGQEDSQFVDYLGGE